MPSNQPNDAGPESTRQSARPWRTEGLPQGVGVSSFGYWEIETLLLRKRIRGISSTDELREQAAALGLAEIEIDGSIAIAAARLRAFHGDPADRIIVATAQLNESTLVTADEALLDWGSALRTLDASR